MAAYQPIGAASLAASYVNLQNPGTYDAAPGVAPTFNAATGWTFNGTTQYLTTGVVPLTSGWSMIVRFTSPGTNVKRYIGGTYRDNLGQAQLLMAARWDGGSLLTYYGNGVATSLREVSPRMDSGVIAVAGGQGYRNGSADGAAFTNAAYTGTAPGILIAAMNYNGAAIHHSGITVQSWAIYSAVLTAGEVATLTTLMGALPVAAAKGLPIIAHHHRQVFGG